MDAGPEPTYEEKNESTPAEVKGCNGIANNVNPDQTALQDQFNLDLHCLLWPICLNISGTYINKFLKHEQVSVHINQPFRQWFLLLHM